MSLGGGEAARLDVGGARDPKTAAHVFRLSLRVGRRAVRADAGVADRLTVRAALPVPVGAGNRRAASSTFSRRWKTDRRCAGDQRAHSRRPRRRLRARHRAGAC